jgi:hypothetical protein
MMNRLVTLLLLPVTAALLIGATSDDGKHRGQQDVYFGFLLGSFANVPGVAEPVPRLAGVAIDLSAPDRNGRRTLRGYVCDGFDVPAGLAVWFRGDVQAKPDPATFPLTIQAVHRPERLVIQAINDQGVYGTLIEATGATSQFTAYPATDGAGIYEVTLDENLRYVGTSTDGSTLEAVADRTTGRTVGTIKPAQGKQIDFAVRSLGFATPAELTSHGLPTLYTQYKPANQVPGEYVAVIAPGGSHWFGRIGSIKLSSGITDGIVVIAEIIGLDKKELTSFRR